MPPVHRGLAHVSPEDAVTRARLTLMIPRWEPVMSGIVTASRWLGSDPETDAIARASGDEDLFARSMQPLDLHDQAITESLAGLAERWQRPEAVIRAFTICGAYWRYHNGDLCRARTHFEHLLTVADRFDSVHGHAEAAARLALIQLTLGDRATARQTMTGAEAQIARPGPDHRLHASLWRLRALLAEFDDGSWEELAAFFVPFVADPTVAIRTTAIDDAALVALALVRMGHPDRARQMLEPLTEILGRLEPTMWPLKGAVGVGATAVWAIGAADLVAPFRDAAEGLIAAGHGDFPGASSLLTVARMSSLLGDHPSATVAFAEARTHLELSGQRPLRVMVDLDEASALFRRRGGDPATVADERLAARHRSRPANCRRPHVPRGRGGSARRPWLLRPANRRGPVRQPMDRPRPPAEHPHQERVRQPDRTVGQGPRAWAGRAQSSSRSLISGDFRPGRGPSPPRRHCPGPMVDWNRRISAILSMSVVFCRPTIGAGSYIVVVWLYELPERIQP